MPFVCLPVCLVFDRDHPALYVESIRVRDFRWIWADDEPREVSQPCGLEARVKYRHCMTDVPCTVHRWVVHHPCSIQSLIPCRDTRGLNIIFRTPQKGIAPGQIATIYSRDWCLGCGIIEEGVRT